MAIEVITGYYSGGAEMVEKYEAANKIAIREGHLEVRHRKSGSTNQTGSIVAAFAPGKWVFARVVEAESKQG